MIGDVPKTLRDVKDAKPDDYDIAGNRLAANQRILAKAIMKIQPPVWSVAIATVAIAICELIRTVKDFLC